MNAVRANDHIGLDRYPAAIGALKGGNSRAALIDGNQPVPGDQPLSAQPGFRFLEQGDLQDPPVDRNLRHRIAGIAPARLAPDALAVAVVIDQLARGDAQRFQLRRQPQPVEDRHGMRQQIDPDAQLIDLGNGLIDRDIVSGIGQQQGCNAAGDPGAGNTNLHVRPVKLANA